MDEASIVSYIADTYADVDILTAGSGTFFSCEPEKHWPNLARRGVHRLNIGLSKATFESVVKPLLDEAHAHVDKGARKVAARRAQS